MNNQSSVIPDLKELAANSQNLLRENVNNISKFEASTDQFNAICASLQDDLKGRLEKVEQQTKFMKLEMKDFEMVLVDKADESNRI